LAKVKWYNPDKRYGFVELSDGAGDAFLHATALAGVRVTALRPGETLVVRVVSAERGLLVTEVLSVDSSTAVPPRSSRRRFRSSSDRQSLEASVQEMGKAKW
jgi:cold shock protein